MSLDVQRIHLYVHCLIVLSLRLCVVPRYDFMAMITLQGINVHSMWKEGHVLFNDALNTFYLRLYGVRHMVNDHSDSEKGNPLPPHRLLFPTNSKGYFICTIPQTG